MGTTLGNAGINVSTFHLGRMAQGGDSICIVEVDGEVPADVMDAVQKIPNVQQVKALRF